MKRRTILAALLLFALMLFPDALAEGAAIAASGTCGANGGNLTWQLDSEGTLTIEGNGEMEDYSVSVSAPWYSERDSIINVNIASGAASIGDEAFYFCKNLTSITIPEGITSIGKSAFLSCSALTAVDIPDGISSINYYAFAYCSDLISITIPDGVTFIDRYAFSGCKSLKSITIPAGVTEICNYAFFDSGLKHILFQGKNEISIGSTAAVPYAATVYCYQTSPVRTWASSRGNNVVCIDDMDMSLPLSLTLPKTVSLTAGTRMVIPFSLFPEQNTPGIQWSSSASNVVSVESGVLAAVSQGEAIITATASSGVTAQCTVTVYGSSVLSLPTDLAVIKAEAFSNVDAKKVIVPDGCASIGSRAFADCARLHLIIIPETVTEIADDAFEGCPNITIAAPAGSCAETYAGERGIPFVSE